MLGIYGVSVNHTHPPIGQSTCIVSFLHLYNFVVVVGNLGLLVYGNGESEKINVRHGRSRDHNT